MRHKLRKNDSREVMPKSEARQNEAGEKQVMASGSAGGHDIDGDEIIHLKTQNGGPGRDKKVFVSVFTNKPRCDNWSDPEQLDQYIQDLTGWIYFMTCGLIDNADELIGIFLSISSTDIQVCRAFPLLFHQQQQNAGLPAAGGSAIFGLFIRKDIPIPRGGNNNA